MKRIIALIAIFLLISFFAATESLAQVQMERPVEMSRRGSRIYNPATLEEIDGEVLTVNKVNSRRDQGYGVHLSLKNAEETFEVHLGPEWYLEEQNFSVEPGDRLEVKGSRITFPGMPTIVAAEVKKADRVLTLRDSNGIPKWSRRQQRSKLQKVDLKKGLL